MQKPAHAEGKNMPNRTPRPLRTIGSSLHKFGRSAKLSPCCGHDCKDKKPQQAFRLAVAFATPRLLINLISAGSLSVRAYLCQHKKRELSSRPNSANEHPSRADETAPPATPGCYPSHRCPSKLISSRSLSPATLSRAKPRPT